MISIAKYEESNGKTDRQNNNEMSVRTNVPSKEISFDPPHSSAFFDTTENPEANMRPSTAHVSSRDVTV